MASSFFRHSSIFRLARVKYGSEGCDVCGAGSEGFAAGLDGGICGVEQAISSAAKSPKAISVNASCSSSCRLRSVRLPCALLLQLTSFVVSFCLSSNIVLSSAVDAIRIPFPETNAEAYRDGEE